MITNQQLSEAGLIDCIISGNIPAFELLIRKYNPYLYKIGRSYGFNHQDVEDLMQETFIHAYENLGRLKNKEHFKTWLLRIMLHECYRKRHKAASCKEVEADASFYEQTIPFILSVGSRDTEKNIGNKELHSIIEEAINQIPFNYRVLFTLRALECISVNETAGMLHITEANVKVRLNRAKAMLRKRLNQIYTPEDLFEFNPAPKKRCSKDYGKTAKQ